MEAGQMEPQVYSGVVLLAWQGPGHISRQTSARHRPGQQRNTGLCVVLNFGLRQTKSEAIKTGLTYEYAKKAAFPFPEGDSPLR